MNKIVLPAVFLIFLSCSISAIADSVRVLAISGGRALVNVNSNAEVTMTRGSEIDGVRLLAIRGGVAEFSILGDLHNLTVGQTAIVTSSAFLSPRDPESHGISIRKDSDHRVAKEFSISSDRQGNFYTIGTINGVPMRFQIDTGATIIAMSRATGISVGLPFEKGVRVIAGTASGQANSFVGSCREVTVGPIRLENVLCAVSEKSDNGMLNQVTLLGNSFLRRLKMRQENGVLTLIQD